MDVWELLVLDMELFCTHESESSEYWKAVEVPAVGSYYVALGAVLSILVGFVVKEVCPLYLVSLELDNLDQQGFVVGMLRNSITLWVLGKLEAEKRLDKAKYDALMGWRPVRWSLQFVWEPRELSVTLLLGCTSWRLRRWLGPGLWRRLGAATEQGGLGRPGGPDEEHAVGLHEELLLPSPDVAHDALQLTCASC